MSRHAATNRQHLRRSTSVEAAYRAGLVTGTLDLTRPAALTVRERATRSAARYGAVLSMMAALIWLYDVARYLHG